MSHRLLVAVGLAVSIATLAGCRPPRPRRPRRMRSVSRQGGRDVHQAQPRRQPRRLGRAELHHRRHRGARRARDAGDRPTPSSRFAKEAVKFDKVEVPADQRRQLNLLKVSLVLATPSDPKEAEELTTLVSSMRGVYGKGKWCADPAKPDACMNIDDITKVLATSRNEKEIRAGVGGLAHHLAADARRTTSASPSCRTRARRSSGLPTPARCGARSTTWRRMRSPRSSIASGIRCGRSTCSCTPTCG